MTDADPKHIRLEAGGGSFEIVTMSATLSTRVNLAARHLLGAARFSRQVGIIESANIAGGWGEWWEEAADYAVACLFLTSACLESYANELFSDRAVVFPNQPGSLIEIIWSSNERKNPIEKLTLALEVLGKPKIDKSDPKRKAIGAMIRLRNELTHFKPEWSHDLKKHPEISKVLEGYFTPSTVSGDTLIFPRAWVCHECTRWAVDTTLTYIQHFENVAGIGPRIEWNNYGAKITP